MMKRKSIMLLFLILILTGCSVDYNLTIDDNTIKETTIFNGESNGQYTKDYMYSLYEEKESIYYDEETTTCDDPDAISCDDTSLINDDNTYYEKSIIDNGNSYTATYNANYSFSDYKRSRLLNSAYKTVSTGYDGNDNTYFIIANNLIAFKNIEFLNRINININLKGYKVVEGNYHEHSGSNYKWYFDRNTTNNQIYIKYQKANNDNQITEPIDNNKKKKRNNYGLYIFLFILLGIIIYGYFWFSKLQNKDQMND